MTNKVLNNLYDLEDKLATSACNMLDLLAKLQINSADESNDLYYDNVQRFVRRVIPEVGSKYPKSKRALRHQST